MFQQGFLVISEKVGAFLRPRNNFHYEQWPRFEAFTMRVNEQFALYKQVLQ